jgi:DNA-binding MarR family transcriptional regulator
MGRGISRLQRQILCLSLQEKFVTCEEILTKLWGWQRQKRGAKEAAMDKAKYASAHATLSRSLTRLWARGLIIYWRTLTHSRTAVSLTPAGKALAQAISAEDQDE